MAKDIFHNLVKEALIKDGWKITHDPYSFEKWDPEWEIDLGAEKIIGATKENKKIAVEVKSFLATSFAYEFHQVLGQYMNYRLNLNLFEEDRVLYLAVPLRIWKTDFQRKGIKVSIEGLKVKILVYNIELKSISQWINYQ